MMPFYLPRWLLLRLVGLYDKFKTKEFSFEDSLTILNDDSRVVAIVLSDLNKNGWVDIKHDPNDSRKKLYSLKHADIIEKMKLIEIYPASLKEKADLKKIVGMGRKINGKFVFQFPDDKKKKLKKLRDISSKETT
jgi:hypothetical protein